MSECGSCGVDGSLTFDLAGVAQLLLDGEFSPAVVGVAETRHFLFVQRDALRVWRIVPGELGAGRHHPDGHKTHQLTSYRPTQTSSRRRLHSSSSPVGEEGDDGESGVVGVREDVLDEQVRVATVLQGAETRSKGRILIFFIPQR